MNEKDLNLIATDIASTWIKEIDKQTVSDEVALIVDRHEVDSVTEAVLHKIKTDIRANGDKYHSMDEMYLYRALYNAALFNAWNEMGRVEVCKSLNHSDGQPVFDGYFIVVAELPTGQISNHYPHEFWNLFNIPERNFPPEYDGHSPSMAAARLMAFLTTPQGMEE